MLTAAEMIVAKKTAWLGIPDKERIAGLTKMIYDIAKKVVIPATTSVETVVPCSLSLKKFSILKRSPI